MQDGLLDIVKAFLDITWTDDATEKKLTLMINNAIADLDAKSGIKNDYTTPGKAQDLLLNRVSYDMVHALDDFYINYRKDIIAFINKAKVKKYVDEQKSNE